MVTKLKTAKLNLLNKCRRVIMIFKVSCSVEKSIRYKAANTECVRARAGVSSLPLPFLPPTHTYTLFVEIMLRVAKSNKISFYNKSVVRQMES